ncbi:DUF6468 domain-containing protein [Hansschlegelia zhihuaiae]|nr:DUF6468 domain-containing protein [Hansschlegelia zhihuaiae]
MDNVVGLAIESLVAVLLVATIFYCATLDRRLRRLRSDETTMRDTITELVGATHAAERAIAALRATVAQSEETLSERLGKAAALSEQMAVQLADGEQVIERIAKIAKAARDHASREAAIADVERIKTTREEIRREARRDAEREAEAARLAAEPPVSASAAAAAAAELFSNRIRALSLGAAT